MKKNSFKTAVASFAISAVALSSLIGLKFPVTSAAGEFADGTGTVSDPYQIQDCTELQNMGNHLAAHYVLIENIDCSLTDPNNPDNGTSVWAGANGFNPIGNSTTAFTGTLEGNGYVISNLYSSHTSTAMDLGLFGDVAGATIKRVGLSNVAVTGTNGAAIGALVGSATNTTMDKDFVSVGTISASGEGSGVTIGGLVGVNGGGSNLTNSYANVSVSTGISFANVGGLVGSDASSTIQNCYSVGAVSATGSNPQVGGLFGQGGGGTINTSYFDLDTSGQPDQSSLGRHTAQMKSQDINSNGNTFYSWDFLAYNENTSATWAIDEGNSYPTLVQHPYYEVETTADQSTIGSGSTGIVDINDADTNVKSMVVNWTNSLKGWWPLNDHNGQFEVGTLDSLGTSPHTMTANGGATWTDSGKFGSAYNFNGTDGYLQAPASDDFNVGNNFTISAWIKPNDISSTSRIFTKENGYSFGINNGQLELTTYNVKDYVSPTTSLTNGAWHMVTVTMDSSNTVIFYVDGGQFGDALTWSDPASTGSSPVDIGRGCQNNSQDCGEYFNGTIDDVQFYNRAIDPSEIISLYDGHANPYSHSFTNLADGGYGFMPYAQYADGTITSAESMRQFTVGGSSSITTCNNLANVNNNLSGDYTLANDLDCASSVSDIIIGTADHPFTGTFNGQGHTINVAINSTNPYAGLFGATDGATIHEVRVTGSVAGGNIEIGHNGNDHYSFSGGLVGYAHNTTIYQTVSNATIVGNGNGVGGLVGELDGNSSTITDSYATGDTSSTYSLDLYTGGLVGILHGGQIETSYSRGKVEGQQVTGGLVGTMKTSGTWVKDSFSVSRVVNNEGGNTSGLIGLVYTTGFDGDDNASTAHLINDAFDAGRSYKINCTHIIGGSGFNDANNCFGVDGTFNDLSYFKVGYNNAPGNKPPFMIGSTPVWNISNNPWSVNGVADASLNTYPTLNSILNDEDVVHDNPTVPGIPQNLVAAGGKTVNLTWNRPVSDGNAPITNYTVQYKKHSDSSWTTSQRGVGDNTDQTVTGLTLGLQYDFRVAAVNAIGTSDFLQADPITTALTQVDFDNSATLDSIFTRSAMRTVDFTYSVNDDHESFSTYSMTSGSLPPGITFNIHDGTMRGVPTQVGTYQFTIHGEDDFHYADKEFTLSVFDPQIYKITNCSQLQNIARDPHGTYTLENDIDCSATGISDTHDSHYNPDLYNDGAGFTPIANFDGTLNGLFHTISHLKISRGDSSQVGLFANTLNNADINNLSLTDETLTGQSNVGGLIGESSGELELSYINVTGTTFAGQHLGGIIGYVTNDSGHEVFIENATANYSLPTESTTSNVGGLIGDLVQNAGHTNITGSSATLNISQGDGMTKIGGLIGYAFVSNNGVVNINGSSSSGTIDNTGSSMGGLIGSLYSEWDEDSDEPQMYISYNHSDMQFANAQGDVGGLIGSYQAGLHDASVTFEHDYYTGAITGLTGNNAGGFVGNAGSYTTGISDSYSTANITPATNAHVEKAGGLVGSSSGSVGIIINDVYTTGNVGGSTDVGGIIGYADNATLSNMYSTGNITNQADSTDNFGGLIGYFAKGTLNSSFSVSHVTAGSTALQGGVVGSFDHANATLDHAYYDQNTSGQSHCSAYVDSGTVYVDTSAVCEPITQVGYFFNSAHAPLTEWPFTPWVAHEDTYPTFDIQTLAPTLIAPAAGMYRDNQSLNIEFTLPERMQAGSLNLTFISVDNYINLHLRDAEDNHDNVFTLHPGNGGLSTTATEIINPDQSIIPPGHYRLVLSYVDEIGNASASTSVADVFINSLDPVLTQTTGISSQSTLANAVYHFHSSKACEAEAEEPHSSLSPVETIIDPINAAGDYTATLNGMQVGGTYSFNFGCIDTEGNHSNTLNVGPFTVVAGGGIALVPGSNITTNGGGGPSYHDSAPTSTSTDQTQQTTETQGAFPFTDMDNNFALDFVKFLWGKGIVQGITPTEYKPNDNMTRAQLMKIALLTFGYQVEQDPKVYAALPTVCKDSDLDVNAWYAPYLWTAVKAGIISGYSDGTCHPNDSVKRSEALKIVIMAAKKDYSGAPTSPFTDVAADAWYKPYVDYAFWKGVVSGKTKTLFKPEDNITRGEMAKIDVLTYQLQ